MQIKKYKLSNIGENFGSNLIASLFDGEIQRETLSGEGSAALDFQLKYKNFFDIGVKQIGVQVKTGKSYTEWLTTKKCYSLRNIDPEHIEKWKKNNQSVIILWVNPKKKIEVYWKFIKPTSSSDFLYLTNNNLLRPHSIFEIDRLFTLSQKKSKNGIPLITLKDFSTLADVKKWSKKEYSKIRGDFLTPFGIISISGYAWKHLIRKNRNVTHIFDSLLLLRNVKTILNFYPDQIQTISPDNNPENLDKHNNNILSQKRVLFIYRNVNFNDKKGCTVYIRMKETIIYPKNWRENFFAKDKLQYKLTLESIYRKT
ncbi:DUF4365 domain-containing protein [Flavobacterium anhuiense]|uniref:DUF4365 domain-containing protein n=1 Tax=Flavobacterium anhuiense TaxID=459526 RepID=UPI000E6CA0F4|nr:DUF4365 domain-containing protein [Flavobacterium anhuiense]